METFEEKKEDLGKEMSEVTEEEVKKKGRRAIHLIDEIISRCESAEKKYRFRIGKYVAASLVSFVAGFIVGMMGLIIYIYFSKPW